MPDTHGNAFDRALGRGRQPITVSGREKQDVRAIRRHVYEAGNDLARVAAEPRSGPGKPTIDSNAAHRWHSSAVRIADALTGQNLPKTETEMLLAWAIGKPRSFLVSHPETELTQEELDRFSQATARRRKKEPVQHITGTQEFYGRMFAVDGRALIPRGSTEDLVRIALDFLKNPRDSTEEVDTDIVISTFAFGNIDEAKTVVDIGTGSGAIAVTLALERPDLKIIATDLSKEALTLAAENAKTLGAAVEFRQGSCLVPTMDLTEPFVIVSNPPYIPVGNVLMKDVVDYEPHLALFGGQDGGDIARKILTDAKNHPFCRGIVMECMTGQLPKSH